MRIDIFNILSGMIGIAVGLGLIALGILIIMWTVTIVRHGM